MKTPKAHIIESYTHTTDGWYGAITQSGNVYTGMTNFGDILVDKDINQIREWMKEMGYELRDNGGSD